MENDVIEYELSFGTNAIGRYKTFIERVRGIYSPSANPDVKRHLRLIVRESESSNGTLDIYVRRKNLYLMNWGESGNAVVGNVTYENLPGEGITTQKLCGSILKLSQLNDKPEELQSLLNSKGKRHMETLCFFVAESARFAPIASMFESIIAGEDCDQDNRLVRWKCIVNKWDQTAKLKYGRENPRTAAAYEADLHRKINLSKGEIRDYIRSSEQHQHVQARQWPNFVVKSFGN